MLIIIIVVRNFVKNIIKLIFALGYELLHLKT